MSYDGDMIWHCGCGADTYSACRCQDRTVREALYARLSAQGIVLGLEARIIPLETLAAVLVAVEDPFWTDGDSARLEDARYMIQLIKEGEGRPR